MVLLRKLSVRTTALLLSATLLTFRIAAAAELPRSNPVPGGVAIVHLTPDSTPAPIARFRKQRVMVVKHQGHWTAIVGLTLGISPGRYSVTASRMGQKHRHYRLRVKPKEYAAQYLTIKNKRYVEPTSEDLKRIQKDKHAINAAFRTWRSTDQVELDFTKPVNGVISSSFGLRRFLNNAPRNPHSGIDIAAPEKTPVLAPAAGTVIEFGNYFFNGNTVLIDHGQGLISMFSHMKTIDVKIGQKLSRGDKLGEVGMTGRVTGPHLHWTVSLNNSRVDPTLFLPASQAVAGPPVESAP